MLQMGINWKKGSQQESCSCLQDLAPEAALHLNRAGAQMQFRAVSWEVSVPTGGELVGQTAPLNSLVRNQFHINKDEGREKSFFLLHVPEQPP